MEAALDFVGLEGFKPEAAHLLFLTFASKQRVSTEEFCRMVLP